MPSERYTDMDPNETGAGVKIFDLGKANGACDTNRHAVGPASADVVLFNAQPTPTGVPATLIIGTTESPDRYTIDSKHLGQLSAETIARLVENAETAMFGEVKFCRLGATPSVGSLRRLKSFLEHGDYEPFLPFVPLEVVNESGIAVDWSSAIVKPNNGSPTQVTRDYYTDEMRLYLFALDIRYEKLRSHSSKKLMTGYPVFATETLVLLEHIFLAAYGKNSEEAHIQPDMELVRFIKLSAERNRIELVKHPRFLQMLRGSVAFDNPLGHLLLDLQINTSKQMQTALPMSRTLVKSEGREPSLATTTSTKDTGTDLLINIHDALMKGRLMTANASGFGTLIRGSGTYRNKDFTFGENELLLADLSAQTFNGHNNIIVENARGQRGDVLRVLLTPVSPTLGRSK